MFLKLEASVFQVSSPRLCRERGTILSPFFCSLAVNNCKTLKNRLLLIFNKYSIQNCKRKQRKEHDRSWSRFQFAPQRKLTCFHRKKVLGGKSCTMVFLSLSTTLPPQHKSKRKFHSYFNEIKIKS